MLGRGSIAEGLRSGLKGEADGGRRKDKREQKASENEGCISKEVEICLRLPFVATSLTMPVADLCQVSKAPSKLLLSANVLSVILN